MKNKSKMPETDDGPGCCACMDRPEGCELCRPKIAKKAPMNYKQLKETVIQLHTDLLKLEYESENATTRLTKEEVYDLELLRGALYNLKSKMNSVTRAVWQRVRRYDKPEENDEEGTYTPPHHPSDTD